MLLLKIYAPIRYSTYWSNIVYAKPPYLVSKLIFKGNVLDVLEIFYFSCQGNL